MKALRLALFLFLPVLAMAAPAPYFNAALSNSPTLAFAAPSGGTAYFFGYNAANPNSSTVYLQFFDAASGGAVTIGSTTPFFVMAIPGLGVLDGNFLKSIAFAKGIVIAATTTATGGTAPGSAVPISIFHE